jgi:hypothetical protein
MYPDALPIFSFAKGTVVDEEFLLKSPRLRAHAIFLTRTFSSTLDMLGPDLEVMYEPLAELGEKHKQFGLTEKHYNFMRCSSRSCSRIVGRRIYWRAEGIVGRMLERNDPHHASWSRGGSNLATNLNRLYLYCIIT